jgi:hypothetical protein
MKTNSSEFHLGAISLLAQSDKVTSLSVVTGTLQDIVDAIKLFGGTVHVLESEHNTIMYLSRIGNCNLFIHNQTTNLACVLQKEAFQSKESVFEKGTDLTIIDNQYIVLKDSEVFLK